MEFIQYLDRVEIEIIRIVKQAGYSIKENTPLCKTGKEYIGFLKKKQKTIVICTDNVKNKEGYTFLKQINNDKFNRIARHIKKAIRHEAVHVGQECNNGKVLPIKKKITLNPAKIKALKGSIRISGEEEKERQAYILEDKPRLLKKELKKYCL